MIPDLINFTNKSKKKLGNFKPKAFVPIFKCAHLCNSEKKTETQFRGLMKLYKFSKYNKLRNIVQLYHRIKVHKSFVPVSIRT